MKRGPGLLISIGLLTVGIAGYGQVLPGRSKTTQDSRPIQSSKDSTGVPAATSAPQAPADTAVRPAPPAANKPPDTTGKDSTQYIMGLVTAEHNQSLDGATIKASNGQTVSAGASGGFRVPYTANMRITVSSVGYKDTTVTVGSPTDFLKIVLTSDQGQHNLSDVKVTALGISKNGNSVGYSVQEIKGAAVQTAKEANFVNAMQGKLAGVQISGNTGSMGGSSKITIRGNKSITGDNNALFVVDGVFMGNSNPVPSYNQEIGGGGFDYGSPIQDINPDDIDQISVLKGAAATALYGSRGANGVVLITTKKRRQR